MNLIDWLLVGLAAVAAVHGFRSGFVVGVLALVGFFAGAFLGTRIADLVLSQGAQSPYAPLFGVAGALLAGAFLASGFEEVGWRIRLREGRGPIAIVDGVLGAALSAFVAVAIFWLLGAIALQTPGLKPLRTAVERSAVLRTLNSVMPPSGVILHALARIDPIPPFSGPFAPVGPPPPAIANAPGVRADAGSVVRVVGTACGLGIEGSGWVTAPDTVVTNAHVVAGEHDTAVEVRGVGPDLAAKAVYFDPHNDIAVLHVGSLDARPLALSPVAKTGTPGAILGFPLDGPYDVRAARLGPTETVLSQDAYGNGPTPREVTLLRGLVRHGNSGGPVVDVQGRVLTTVFAASDTDPRSGFGVPDPLITGALRHLHATVGTGPCANP